MVLRLIPDGLNIEFSKYRNITLLISSTLTVFSIFLIIFQGLNLGVDFTGGILIEISSTNNNNLIVDLLNKNGFTVQSSESGNNLIMHFKEIGNENTINTIKTLLEEKFGSAIIYRKVDYVGPQVSFIQIIEGALAISVAKKLNIPLIAILDTNSNPDNITYPIPGNDDSRKSIELYAKLAADSILVGIESSLTRSGVEIDSIKNESLMQDRPEKEINIIKTKKKRSKINQEEGGGVE